MGHRLSKIYTKTGDKGSTGLGDGSRVDKDDLRVEAYGAVDELNSYMGLILSGNNIPEIITQSLVRVQHELFSLGGELSVPNHTMVTSTMVTQLEKDLDKFNQDLPWLKEFILPGGSQNCAYAHLARTVCRRAERRLVSLSKHQTINTEALRYLNRLSDLLFVIARVLVRADGGDDVLWKKNKN